jgi:hypothetical protein
MNKKIQKFKDFKKNMIEEILSDTTMSNREKLEIIHNENLWGSVAPFIQHEFREWEQECKDMEVERAVAKGKDPNRDYICKLVDTFIHDDFYDKYETVYYMDVINRIENGYYDEDNDEYYPELDIKDDEMVVVTNRGDEGSLIIKKKSEVIEKLATYAIQNKIIGFKMDW